MKLLNSREPVREVKYVSPMASCTSDEGPDRRGRLIDRYTDSRFVFNVAEVRDLLLIDSDVDRVPKCHYDEATMIDLG